MFWVGEKWNSYMEGVGVGCAVPAHQYLVDVERCVETTHPTGRCYQVNALIARFGILRCNLWLIIWIEYNTFFTHISVDMTQFVRKQQLLVVSNRQKFYAGTLFLAIAGAIWGWFTFVRLPAIVSGTSRELDLYHPVTVIIFSVLIGMAITMLLLLMILNPRKNSRFFRLSRARLIGSVVLFFTLPVAVFLVFPMSNIFAVGAFILSWRLENPLHLAVPDIFHPNRYAVLVNDMFGSVENFISVTVFIGLCYLISCILISGFGSRGARISGFILVFWAGYSVISLRLGYMRGI